MRPGAALFGGLVGAGAVVAILAFRKNVELKRRAATLRAAVEAEADDLTLYLAAKGEGLAEEIRVEATHLAEQEARAEGERVLALEYGWGAHLFEDVDRLYRRLS